MGGIFLGFLCATLLIFVLGRLKASHPPSGLLGLACWTLIALTGLDGLNAFLFDGNLPHLYSPNGAVRLLTGLGGALILAGVGVLLWPVALAMLAGVVVAFGVANLYVLVLATRRAGQAVTFADLSGG